MVHLRACSEAARDVPKPSYTVGSAHESIRAQRRPAGSIVGCAADPVSTLHFAFFDALTKADIRKVIDIQSRGLLKRLEDRKIVLEMTDAARDLLVDEGYDPVYGARPLKRTLQRRVRDPLAMAVLQGDFKDGDTVVADAVDGHVSLRRAWRSPEGLTAGAA
jgi:hypothetical protein